MIAPPISIPMDHKAQGWVFLNGNVATEQDLVGMFRHQMLHPQHQDPVIDKSCKVLLITAAFFKGHEHHDRHLISMFERMGIDAGWNGPYPTNIQNLSVYSMFLDFKEKEKWLYRRYTEKQDQLIAAKRDYHSKNQHYLDRVTEDTDRLEGRYENLSLYEFYHYDEFDEPDYLLEGVDEEERDLKLADIKRLKRSSRALGWCQEIRDLVDHLNYKDEEIFSLCRHIEAYFLEKSGVLNSSLYQEQREDMQQRILSSASCILFGGRVFVLTNRLRFYRLGEVFQDALTGGTNFFGISAGTMCLQERYFLSLPRDFPGGFLRAADQGVGLVSGLSVFPHAYDYRYIREAHQDELSLFTLRHRDRVAMGLNEKSVLLCEKYCDPVNGKIYKRYSSVGDDPVIVFGERGRSVEMEQNDELILDGAKFFDGRPKVGTREDICSAETEWRTKKDTRKKNHHASGKRRSTG